jgi:hypothetical protein
LMWASLRSLEITSRLHNGARRVVRQARSNGRGSGVRGVFLDPSEVSNAKDYGLLVAPAARAL